MARRHNSQKALGRFPGLTKRCWQGREGESHDVSSGRSSLVSTCEESRTPPPLAWVRLGRIIPFPAPKSYAQAWSVLDRQCIAESCEDLGRTLCWILLTGSTTERRDLENHLCEGRLRGWLSRLQRLTATRLDRAPDTWAEMPVLAHCTLTHTKKEPCTCGARRSATFGQ